MDMDNRAHCRAGSRPGQVWCALVLLGEQKGLADEILLMIHEKVRLSTPEEREGHNNALARIEREKRARLEAAAEEMVPRWRLLGFPSLRAYLFQVRTERRAEAERNMPEWAKFGFCNSDKFKRACQRAGAQL